jgi:hypothetical protein
MTEQEQKLIDDIMDWFDFEKVGKVMKFLKWSWMTAEEGVPIVPEIRRSARRMLKEAIENKTTISSGGLKATYVDGYLKLEFILSEMDSSID